MTKAIRVSPDRFRLCNLRFKMLKNKSGNRDFVPDATVLSDRVRTSTQSSFLTMEAPRIDRVNVHVPVSMLPRSSAYLRSPCVNLTTGYVPSCKP